MAWRNRKDFKLESKRVIFKQKQGEGMSGYHLTSFFFGGGFALVYRLIDVYSVYMYYPFLWKSLGFWQHGSQKKIHAKLACVPGFPMFSYHFIELQSIYLSR